MLLFILGLICCWYVIAITIVVADIDILPLSFYNFITFPIWIIFMTICYVIVFICLVKFKIMNLLKRK